MAHQPDTSQAALLAILADAGAGLDERIAAADALAELGDPRLAARTMIDVPAGVLQHQAARGAPFEATEVGAFAIAEHLVTVSEFGEMIEAGGYDDPALWSPAGWGWRLDHDVEHPRFWGEPDEWAIYLRPNRPVVGVSVFEAEAYAAFVGMRLPTELEWERACRGDDTRAFPWGEEWDEHAAGHRDYGPRATLPIGVFPRGLSPYGLHDMVGNVWQWTSDERGSAGEHGPPRVVCGGAWNNLPWSIGAAGRNAYPPTAQFSNLGFRLANDPAR